MQESESFIHSNRFACCLLLSVLDTVWKTKVLANKSEKIFPASKCSKDLLVRLYLLQASSLVLVTSSLGHEMVVMAAKPSVATVWLRIFCCSKRKHHKRLGLNALIESLPVPMSTAHPARVLGANRYLGNFVHSLTRRKTSSNTFTTWQSLGQR